ncbi:MAG: preprotein translocase subunit SecG [Leptospira sp.]|jgi:preprotein translocase subunit SecG|nr:preprotein translocase subunit SecG [Leptospira sp.]NCS93472.1 preprotein translocase subunit SecG [Leptospira sp.]
MGFLITSVLVIFCVTCLFLIFLVMVQTSKGSSSGMLTGGGSSSVFGASTADVMTKITRWTGVIFILLALLLSFLFAKSDDKLIPEALNDPGTFQAAPELNADTKEEATTPNSETKPE